MHTTDICVGTENKLVLLNLNQKRELTNVKLSDILGFLSTGIQNDYILYGGFVENDIGSIRIPAIGEFDIDWHYAQKENNNYMRLFAKNSSFELNINLWQISKERAKYECQFHTSKDGWIDIFIDILKFTPDSIFSKTTVDDILEFEMKQRIHLIFCPKKNNQ